MAKLTIDDQEFEFPDGTSLFDACREARGEALPHFCYHPDLPVAGVCRLCQVEVEGMPKLTIACNTGVRDGMVVRTRSEKVTQAVQQILEMHLINHPVDCPICDQAGECGLQDQYMDFGLYESKVEMAAKVNKRKVKVIGPQVILDQERCVLCSRCVRFCQEVTGTGELGIFNRGDRAELDVAPGVELDNNYSLNTVDICPVGALTSRDFRFAKRVWMLKSARGVCPGCATGCNVRIDHEGGRVFRLKPLRNPQVNGSWMCDRGRMTYKAVHDERRLLQPVRDGKDLTWAEASGALAGMLQGRSPALVVIGPHASLEEMYLARDLADPAAVVSGPHDLDRGSGDDILLDGDRSPNRKGLASLGITELGAADLAARVGAAGGPVLVLGGDPGRDKTVAGALAQCANLIAIATHDGPTVQAAALALPGAAWAEKAGTFVNRQGRWQGFAQAVARPGAVRDVWRILAEIQALAHDGSGPQSLRAVRQDLVTSVLSEGELDMDRMPEQGYVPGGGEQ
ncbi:NADH dehydrogenase subunit [bacterium CG_4_9_14_3_um_filter_65_15]|nr:MAG: NADH dehydrogenase subunit [bacterium CG_4_9_14_3_um_filter_65_15]